MSNTSENVRQRGTEVIQSALDRYLNEVILPHLENGLRLQGIEVNASQLGTILGTPVSIQQVQRPQVPQQNSQFQAPFGTLPASTQFPAMGADPSRNQGGIYQGDNYNETGCLYFSRRGASKFIFCGAPVFDGGPVCRGCSNKGDGKKLIQQWQTGTPIDRVAIRNEAAARRSGTDGAGTARSKPSGRNSTSKQVQPLAFGSGFEITRPSPPSFVSNNNAGVGGQNLAFYELECGWKQAGEQLYFLPNDKLVVKRLPTGFSVMGKAENHDQPIRKLTVQESQSLIQQGMKCEPVAIEGTLIEPSQPRNFAPLLPTHNAFTPGSLVQPPPLNSLQPPPLPALESQNAQPSQVQPPQQASLLQPPQQPSLLQPPQQASQLQQNFKPPVLPSMPTSLLISGSYPQPPSFNSSFSIAPPPTSISQPATSEVPESQEPSQEFGDDQIPPSGTDDDFF